MTSHGHHQPRLSARGRKLVSSYLSIVAFAVAAAAMILMPLGTAEAGRGGSGERIANAVRTGSAKTIIAELERAERLVCGSRCNDVVLPLLDDERYEVREAAAWWFARRPLHKAELTQRSIERLNGDDTVQARNAADILGTFRHPQAIAALTATVGRTDLDPQVRQHAVRALGTIGKQEANGVLALAMTDASAQVRLEALSAWHAIPYQADATPVVALIADDEVKIRRKAAAVAGSVRDATARASLEAQLADDDDPVVRRNAAWALGRIGDRASRSVLETATTDTSPLVRMTAKAALRQLNR